MGRRKVETAIAEIFCNEREERNGMVDRRRKDRVKGQFLFLTLLALGKLKLKSRQCAREDNYRS